MVPNALPSSVPPNVPPSSELPEIELLWKVYDLVNEWIRHADQKISLLLATNALVCATFATLMAVLRNPNAQTQTFVFRLFNEKPGAYLCGLSALFVFLSIFFCLLCVLPRLSSNKMSAAQTFLSHLKSICTGKFDSHNSPLYFIDIAALDLGVSANVSKRIAFFAHFQQENKLRDALVAQIAAVSDVANHKYRWTLAAVWSLTVAVCLIFFGVILSLVAMLSVSVR